MFLWNSSLRKCTSSCTSNPGGATASPPGLEDEGGHTVLLPTPHSPSLSVFFSDICLLFYPYIFPSTSVCLPPYISLSLPIYECVSLSLYVSLSLSLSLSLSPVCVCVCVCVCVRMHACTCMCACVYKDRCGFCAGVSPFCLNPYMVVVEGERLITMWVRLMSSHHGVRFKPCSTHRDPWPGVLIL